MATPQSAIESSGWIPSTDAEREAIQAQLERILRHPLFRNSRRYPALLRYVVEATLEGRVEHLKERTLGVEVFNRTPDYDTNVDPIVRTTAVEIRKRIAQYYSETGHESEIRIAFPPGSYVPEFRLPQEAVVPEPISPLVVAPPKASRRVWIGTAIAALATTVGVAFWSRTGVQPSALERFWSPVWATPSPVLLLMGRGTRPNGTAASQTVAPPVVTMVDLMASESVAFADATTLAKLTGLLATKGKPYHIRRFASAKFDDLRDGPAILIGAFNNDWTLRLNDHLRFRFERDHGLSWISDRQNPGARPWVVDQNAPYTDVPEDFGIIARVQDQTTGRLVITAAGLTKFGTAAAGEFLTDPQYVEQLAKEAPSGWDHKNIQVVIATKVVGESSGPPRVVATYFW